MAYGEPEGLPTTDSPTVTSHRVAHGTNNPVNSLAHCVHKSIVNKDEDIVPHLQRGMVKLA